MEPSLSGMSGPGVLAFGILASLGPGLLWCILALLRWPGWPATLAGAGVVVAGVVVGWWLGIAWGHGTPLLDLDLRVLWFIAVGAVAMAVEQRLRQRTAVAAAPVGSR